LSALVLDCSVAVSWLFDDEQDAGADALQELVLEQGAMVPSLWLLEVANVLLQAERRKRIDAAGADERLDLIQKLPIKVEPLTLAASLAAIPGFTRQYGLTSYDAAYLELAIRMGLPLATLDRQLRKAAFAEGVEVMP
jgi:predicted nucleic acid-binding protein